MEKRRFSRLSWSSSIGMSVLSVVFLFIGTAGILTMEPKIRREVNAQASTLSWIVLVQGDVLDMDAVGAKLLKLPDIHEVKFLSPTELLSSFSKDASLIGRVEDSELSNLPSAWRVVWASHAQALTDAQSQIDEIRSYPNVVDVAYSPSMIEQTLTLIDVQNRVHRLRSIMLLASLAALSVLVWLFINKKSLKILIIILGVSTGVLAAPKTTTEIKSKNRDLEKINSELLRIREEKARLNKEASELEDALERTQVKVKDIEQSYLYTRERTVRLETTVAAEKNKKDQIESEMLAKKNHVSKAATSLIVASSLMGPEAPVSAYIRQIYKSRHYDLENKQTHHERQTAVFSELSFDLNALRQELNNQQKSIDRFRTSIDEKERLKKKKVTRAETLEQERSQLEKSKHELAALIENLRSKEQQEQQEAQTARALKAAQGRSPIGTRSLPWPLMGKIIKRFGKQPGSDLGESFISNGVVIQSDSELPVLCVADGTVLFAGPFMSYGSMVVVEHAGDWYSVYGYLKGWIVDKGQSIKKGDPIGSSGPASSGGGEAYFELRFYGKPVDPEIWLVAS